MENAPDISLKASLYSALNRKARNRVWKNSPLVRNEKTISRFHGHIKVLYIFQTGILDEINSEI